MGIALLSSTPSVDRHIAVAPQAVWRLLTDIRTWPRWGPSVRGAALDDGGWELSVEATGTVWTVAGLALPFTITEFEPGRRWSWAVAGVAATGHAVTPVDGGCRVGFEVPWWAPGYLAVCAVALRRIETIVVSG